jgi:hypothetical protein
LRHVSTCLTRSSSGLTTYNNWRIRKYLADCSYVNEGVKKSRLILSCQISVYYIKHLITVVTAAVLYNIVNNTEFTVCSTGWRKGHLTVQTVAPSAQQCTYYIISLAKLGNEHLTTVLRCLLFRYHHCAQVTATVSLSLSLSLSFHCHQTRITCSSFVSFLSASL